MPIVWSTLIRDVGGLMLVQKVGFKWANLINAQGNALVDWKSTQKVRIWTISKGKSMLKRITYAITHSRQTLEDKDILTSEIEWTRLIDVGNYLIGIKGMKA